MPRLALSLLGPFRALLDGAPIKGFESDKVRALLAYLAVEAGVPHRRAALAGLLWPDWPDAAATINLRNTLSALRKVIGEREAPSPLLIADRETVQFTLTADGWVDVAVFQELAAERGTRTSARDFGGGRSEAAAALPALADLESAVALYRGPFLEGFSLGDSAAFEEWALLTRQQLERQCLATLDRLVRGYEQDGDLARAGQFAWRAVDLAPWEEEGHRRLMRLLALSGQRGAALAHFETCRQQLQRELGIDPAAETVMLYERIRQGELRFTEQPTRRAAVAVAATPRPVLPTWLTPLIGREALLDAAGRQLSDPACRLLTLVGAGGIGKTRLAVEAARRQAGAYRDGVYFVPLVAVAAGESLAPAISQVLALDSTAERDSRQGLADYLREKQLLLVLDNFEHLLEAAPVVAELLAGATGVKVLVTSRVPLKVQGEHLLPVPGLAYPLGEPGDQLDPDRYSSLLLFTEAARRVNPAFAPSADDQIQMAAICRLVGGLPLGVLLAAAWARLLSPGEILEQLTATSLDFLDGEWQDLPERQRSLRAVFDHSWRLLSEREREAFARLSVFSGGFTYGAAQQVGGVTLRELLQLVDSSLLSRAPDGRYEMHELLRQYAGEKLANEPHGPHAVRGRHASYWIAALAEWAPALKGPRQIDALAEMDAEIGNVQAAWTWAVECKAAAQLALGMEALGLYFHWRARYQDGEKAFREAADGLPGDDLSAPGELLRVRVSLLARQAHFEGLLGQTTPAYHRLHEALALLDAPALAGQDVRRERALILGEIGASLEKPGTRDDRREILLASLALYRSLGDLWSVAETLVWLGLCSQKMADMDRAIEFDQESLAIRRALAAPRDIIASLLELSFMQSCVGKAVEGARLAREGLALARSLGDRAALAGGLYCLALALQSSGDFAQSLALLDESATLFGKIGALGRLQRVQLRQCRVLLLTGRYAQARALIEASAALARDIDSAWGMGMTAMYRGMLSLAEEQPAEALHHLAEGAAMLEADGNLPNLAEVLALTGAAAAELGDLSQARSSFVEAFRTGGVFDMSVLLMLALPLLAAEGEYVMAIEVHALILSYPAIASPAMNRVFMDRHMAAIIKSLPAETVATARARGRERDVRTTLRVLMDRWEVATSVSSAS